MIINDYNRYKRLYRIIPTILVYYLTLRRTKTCLIPMPRHKTICLICEKPLIGRSDKKFCSLACKNDYHTHLRQLSRDVAHETDKFLHRNRSILYEIMGDRKTQIKIKRDILDKKNFKYQYITGYYINSKGKTYHYVYDFSWMEFSDREILINRRRVKR